MSDDDVDIYDDLPVLNLGESITKIEEERQQLKQQLEKKEQDLRSSAERITLLEKENKTLEENISSLYKTAVSEINRKDKLIEELRREKDAIIFRRKGKQYQNFDFTPDILVDDSRSSQQTQGIAWPGKLIPVTLEENTEEPVRTALLCSTLVNNNLSEVTLEKHHHGSNTYKVNLSDFPKECLQTNTNAEDSDSTVHVPFKCGTAKTSIISISTSDNSYSKFDDVSSDKLSTCSSHTPHDSIQRNTLKEQLNRNNLFKEEREKKTLSLQSRREDRYKKNGGNLQQSYNHSGRRRSLSRERSLKSHNLRSRREERGWKHNEKHYCRVSHKDRQEMFSTGSDGFREKYYSRSGRSPSSKWPSRYGRSPIQRNCERKSGSPKVKGFNRPQSENIRLATQVKSKYSKVRRERSVSHTPVKRTHSKTGRVSPITISKLNLEENNICTQVCSENIQRPDTKMSNGKNVTADNSPICVESTVRRVSTHLVKHNGETNCTVSKCVPNPLEPNLRTSDVDCARYKTGAVPTKQSDIVGKSIELRTILVESPRCSSVKDDFSETRHKKNISEEEREEFSNILNTDCGLPKSQSTSEFKQNNEVENRESFSETFRDVTKSSNLEENKQKQLHTSASLLNTPPSNRLNPLKISPSFEDPAVVKRKNFSFCVFNEQCEFKRQKGRRSVKLVMADVQNDCTVERKENDCDTPSNTSRIQTDLGETITKESEDSLLKLGTTLGDRCKKAMFELPAGVSSEENIRLSKDIAGVSLDIQHSSVNLSCTVSENKLQKNERMNKKRKVDSICEELKKNLKKKSVICTEVGPSDQHVASLLPSSTRANSEENMKSSNMEVKGDSTSKCNTTTIEPAKVTHTVVSRFRRRVHNLQDSVVQVFSQVKSKISQ